MTAFSWSLNHLSCRASWCSEMSVAGSRSPTLSATSDQSLEAKRTQVPRNREGKEQPGPPLLADATNGSWQRHQPLPPSLGMPKTSPMPNACLSSRSQHKNVLYSRSFHTSKRSQDPVLPLLGPVAM